MADDHDDHDDPSGRQHRQQHSQPTNHTGAADDVEEVLFAAALAKRSPAERAAFLADACGGDAALRERVEQLLASHDQAGDFLEAPPADWADTAAAAADI